MPFDHNRQRVRARTGPAGPYLTVGNEFGVTATVVRTICGTIGTKIADNVADTERVAILRRKMEMANFAPMVAQLPEVEEEAEDVLRELRTCVLCESFLDNDDAGEDVVNGEDCTERAVVCQTCRHGYSRI